jgi:hypothetical protein
MYTSPAKLAPGLIVSLTFLACLVPAFATSKHPAHKAKTDVPTPAPIAAPEPPPPLTPGQQPAAAPQVRYSKGELTVISQNSTLGDILRSIHAQTGAEIDIPATATERVVGQMGPASPHDVLAQLLNGSRFNYVLLGAPDDPNKVARVILSLRPPDQPENSSPAPVTAAAAPGDSSGFNQTGSAQDDDEDDNAAGDQTSSDQQPSQSPVRTPEQLLQELQRQQQQQQQQQQQPQESQTPPAPTRQR